MEGLEEFLAKLAKLADVHGSVKAGVLESAKTEDGQDVLDYAPAMEFGIPGRIPARPFLRTTYKEQKQRWLELYAKYMQKGTDAKTALEYVGREMEADIIDKIRSNMRPPNSPAWIKHKMKETPATANNTLMYKGNLVKSIKHEVEG